MRGLASMVGFVRGVARNEVRMIVVSDTEGELARAMSPWTRGQRRGEGACLLAGSHYHGKSHAEVYASLRTIIGPELASLTAIPRVDAPALPEPPRLPL